MVGDDRVEQRVKKDNVDVKLEQQQCLLGV